MHARHWQRQVPIWRVPADQAGRGRADRFIPKGREYDGIRLRFQRALGTARINMQMGTSFRNVVSPALGELNS